MYEILEMNFIISFFNLTKLGQVQRSIGKLPKHNEIAKKKKHFPVTTMRNKLNKSLKSDDNKKRCVEKMKNL